MGDNIPLLDGRNLDRLESLEFSPKARGDKTVVLDPGPDFVSSQLPSWLTYNTDNGPGSATFDGVSGANKGSVTLKTGTNSVDDITSLDGPTIKWGNWSAVRWYLTGAAASADKNVLTAFVMLADNRDPGSVTEGFVWSFPDYDSLNGGTFFHTVTGGTKDVGESYPDSETDASTAKTLGARLFTNEGFSAHLAHLSINGDYVDVFPDSAFPANQDLTFYVGVRTEDTGATRELTFEKFLIELVP